MATASLWKHVALFLIASTGIALIAADGPKQGSSRPPSAPRNEAEEVAEALHEAWPDHPEWVDMLAAILDDEPMGPKFGWFRTAVSQTRFNWDSTRKRFDRDGGGRITRQEFPGGDTDFARLDRDHDQALTAVDFDFSGSALAPSPGAVVYSRIDRDGNGKITRDELDAFFKAADSGGQGFLSLGDLQDVFDQRPRSAESSGRPASNSGMPSKATLVRGLFRQEIGSLQPGPRLDESAPDFTLKANDGKAEITLSKLIGPKPVVLVFGSFTCGPFRSQSGNVEKLYRRYKDRANFVMVYVRDAHPTDGWRMESNDRFGVTTEQPKTYGERVEVAQKCSRLLDLGFPMLVDTIDDAVGARYSGMPGRLYLIDRQGKVAFKSGRGPYLFKPAELEQSLVMLLVEESQRSNRSQVSASADCQRPAEPVSADRGSPRSAAN
jgi:thiol-disulfide isomerase/thioredoxin